MSKRNRGGYTAASKNSGAKVKVIAILVIVLAALYVITSLAMGFVRHSGAPLWNPVKWGKGVEQQSDVSGGDFAFSSDNSEVHGMVIEPSTGSALMGLRAVALSDEDNYAISPQAEKSYLITASVLPEDASNKVVDWFVDWSDPDSDFANDKTVTDYITLTPTEDGALTATVSCYQAFGEQIILTATVRGSENLYATCTIDYLRRQLGLNFYFSTSLKEYPYSWNFTMENLDPVVDFPTTVDLQTWGIGLANTSFVTVGVQMVNSSVYTKGARAMGDSFSFAYTEEYLNALRAVGLTPKVAAEEYTSLSLSNQCFAGLFFANCVSSSPVLPTTSSAWSAFRTSLRDNADKTMIRVKCLTVYSADYVVETIYNVKFSASSLTPVATNITLGDTALEF